MSNPLENLNQSHDTEISAAFFGEGCGWLRHSYGGWLLRINEDGTKSMVKKCSICPHERIVPAS